MGSFNGKILKELFLISVTLICYSFFSLPAYADGTNFTGVMSNFKSPSYQKDTGVLQGVLSGKNAKTIGNTTDLIAMTDVVLQLIEGDKIKQIITTPAAVYNRNTKMIRGNEWVHLRSTAMDIKGIGFDGNTESKTIHVRSRVKVVITGGGPSPFGNQTSASKNDIGNTEKNSTGKVK